MFAICVFGNSSYCPILHQDFWLMQIDLCLDLEVSMGNYLRFFLLGLNFSLEPVIQADTAITQCCNFTTRFLSVGKGFEYHRHKDGSLSQNLR